jgi:hypothetical protein
MKKFMLFFFTLFISVNVIFGFEVFDNTGVSKSYFSLNNYQVSLKSSQNESPLTIMALGKPSTLMSYNFTSCSSDFCYDFSLVDYMTSVGLALNSTEFTISASGSSKSIYFDSEKPMFNLQNSVIDSQNKLLKLYFTFSDDYNVNFVEVFEVKGSSVQSFGQVSSNSFDFPLTYEGNVTLRFKVIDGAGNYDFFDFSFVVLDLFAPEISDIFVIKNDAGIFNLEFSGSDSNLAKYDIVQDDLKLTGVLSGTSFSKDINLPFTSGKIVLTLFDDSGNFESEEISLTSNFNIDVKSKFSNDDEFIFDADAKSCRLVSVGSKYLDEKFSEDDEEFSVDLDLNTEGTYEVSFFCEDSYFRESFIEEFTYDFQKPSESALSLTPNSDGFIKLFWTESEDSVSDVSYKLYKDDKKVYSGSRESFLDEDVLFSESYEYYLEIFDEAGNSLESNVVSGSPNKVYVELTSSIFGDIDVSSSDFDFVVYSELDSETTVVVKNLGKNIFSEIISGSEEDVTLSLVQGVNEIIITSIDDFSNKKVLRYFVTYNKPIPVVSTIEPKVTLVNDVEVPREISGGVIVEEVTGTNSNLVGGENSEISSTKTLDNSLDESFNWFWFLFFVSILFIFIYIFIINENKLSGHLDTAINNSSRNKKNRNSKNPDSFDIKRHTDYVLHKHISNVRAERKGKSLEKKKSERLAKIAAMKPKRNLSHIEKLKLENLNKKSKFDFNISHSNHSDNYKMKSVPVEVKDINEEVFKEETLDNDKDMEIRLKKKPSIFGFFKKQKVELSKKDIEDEKFLGYIGKQRGSQSWDKTDLYRQSHYDKIAAKKFEELKIIEEQRRMELQVKQLEIDEHNKKLSKKAKVEADKIEFNDNRKIARATMDEYLAGKAKKRGFWFAEKAVSKDINSRK